MDKTLFRVLCIGEVPKKLQKLKHVQAVRYTPAFKMGETAPLAGNGSYSLVIAEAGSKDLLFLDKILDILAKRPKSPGKHLKARLKPPPVLAVGSPDKTDFHYSHIFRTQEGLCNYIRDLLNTNHILKSRPSIGVMGSDEKSIENVISCLTKDKYYIRNSVNPFCDMVIVCDSSDNSSKYKHIVKNKVLVTSSYRPSDLENILYNEFKDIIITDGSCAHRKFLNRMLDSTISDSILDSRFPPYGGRKRALVVDDSTTMPSMLAYMLETGGHDTEVKKEVSGTWDIIFSYAHQPGIGRTKLAAADAGIPLVGITDRVKISQPKALADYDLLLELPLDANTISSAVYSLVDMGYSLKKIGRKPKKASEGSMYYMLAGQSGVGKDTLLKICYDSYNDLKKWVRYTDRPRRSNENNGFDFHFVGNRFSEMVISKKINESYTDYGRNYSLDRPIDKGIDFMETIQLMGARVLIELEPEAHIIYIAASKEKTIGRMLSRPDRENSRSIDYRKYEHRADYFFDPFALSLFLLNDCPPEQAWEKPLQTKFRLLKRCAFKVGQYIDWQRKNRQD